MIILFISDDFGITHKDGHYFVQISYPLEYIVLKYGSEFMLNRCE